MQFAVEAAANGVRGQLNFGVKVALAMQYFEDAKLIWTTLVPKSGQADTVQGELIRAIERLRWESHNNGNGNWDEGFDRFCIFLEQTLAVTPPFDEQALREIRADIARLRDFEH